MFVDPNWDMMIQPVAREGETVHYETIRCADYVNERYDNAFGYRKTDAAWHPEDAYSGGLVISNWNFIESELSCHPSECVGFASIESAVYPDLERYYNQYGEAWIHERLFAYIVLIHDVNEDEWPEFLDRLHPEWTLDSLSKLPTKPEIWKPNSLRIE